MARIEDLEVHAAHQTETIDTLNQVIQDHWKHIDALNKLVAALRERLADLEDGAPGPAEQTKPPHY